MIKLSFQYQYPVPNSTIYSDTIVIISVTDDSGNNTICEIPIFLLDTISPVISCPNNTVLDNNSSNWSFFSYLTPFQIDNCVSTTTLTSGLPDSSFVSCRFNYKHLQSNRYSWKFFYM